VVNATSGSVTLTSIVIHIVDLTNQQEVYTQNVADTTIATGATGEINVTFNNPVLITGFRYNARITANYTVGSTAKTIDESVEVKTKA
jgi:hypothetical protein